MKNILPFCIYVATLILCLSCKSNVKDKQLNLYSINNEGFIINNNLESLIDSFIIEIKAYKNKVNLVGYIKLIESVNNNSFVIHLEGIDNVKDLKKVSLDNYFIKDGISFCVDYNCSNLFSPSKGLNKKAFINKSRITKYHAIGTKKLVWLVKIEDNKIKKINKKAFSCFEPKMSGKIDYVTEKGVVTYKLNEWGEVIDDKGNVIDYYPKR